MKYEAIIILAVSGKHKPEEKPTSPQESANQSDSEINYDLIKGDRDRNGNIIEYIYARMPGNYLIYRIENYELKVIAEDASLISSNTVFNKSLVQIGDYIAGDLELKKTYSHSIAFAIKNLYDGNTEIACSSLATTYENISRYLKRRSVAPYLLGSFGLVLISLIAYFLIYRFGNLNDFGHILFSAVVLSALGGFLSVAISLRNVSVDIQDSFKLKMVYGAVRIAIAMISGVIVYFLIEGKIALSFLKDFLNINTYYIAFFIAGFIEKLVANLMLDFEKKDKKAS